MEAPATRPPIIHPDLDQAARDLLWRVWITTDPRRAEVTNTPAFDEFVEIEAHEVLSVVKGMGVRDDAEGKRWLWRALVIRAANHIQEYWAGRCVKCGVVVDRKNAGSLLLRTECEACQTAAAPTPTEQDIWGLLQDCFPANEISGTTVRRWDPAARRAVGTWLHAVLVGNAEAKAPSAILPYSRFLGISAAGHDYFPQERQEHEAEKEEAGG